MSNDDLAAPRPHEPGHRLYSELWNAISGVLGQYHQGDHLRFSERDRIAKAAWLQYVHEIGQADKLQNASANAST
ncbi:hypothetical protein [Rhodococcus sp. 06-235-1A]|uniref:hypothetical protein n=1 Tax=Rhodococcus sp. 06-235-1A TaxID=2022508 RepID=UPI001179A0CB|nr:hypothetical protein [Rhodococcus sp. 06-235-1A]